MDSPAPHWTEEYREVVTFYFWEPQHLRPKAKGDAPRPSPRTPDEMWDHVRGLEVATNHVLNLYLSLVPFDLVNASGGWCDAGDYEHVGSHWLRKAQKELGGFTQPDLYLRGRDRDLAIEIKTRSRSSLRQVHKYVCFHEMVSPGRPLTLLFLTPYEDPSRILVERMPLDAVLPAIRSLPAPKRHAELAPRFTEAVERVRLGAFTFRELSAQVQRLADEDQNPVSRRVHQGLVRWLEDCGLSPGPDAGGRPRTGRDVRPSP